MHHYFVRQTSHGEERYIHHGFVRQADHGKKRGTPFLCGLSLISLMVSVDVKHHVYLLTFYVRQTNHGEERGIQH